MCVMIAVSDQMHTEGLVGEPSFDEFRHRCWQIQRRRSPCPVMDTCEKFKQAGGQIAPPCPGQLKLF